MCNNKHVKVVQFICYYAVVIVMIRNYDYALN